MRTFIKFTSLENHSRLSDITEISVDFFLLQNSLRIPDYMYPLLILGKVVLEITLIIVWPGTFITTDDRYAEDYLCIYYIPILI